MPTSNSRREAPDRNLAMELVRVTEAAAMAAGRWVGRGDKNGGDGAAVDAMRQLIGTRLDARRRRDRRGREGRGAHAVQRRGGRQRRGPAVRRRRRPDRRHHADGQGHARTRSRCSRWPSAARCSTRPRCSTWRSWPSGRRRPTPSTSRCPWPRTSAGSRRRRTSSVADVTVCVLDRPRHAELVEGDPPHRRPHPVHLRRRRRRRDHRAARPNTGIDLLLGIGGTPEGIIAAAALKCMGGAIQGAAVAARRRRAAQGPRRRATTSTGCSPPTTWCSGDNMFFCATGITDGDLLRGVHYRAGRVHDAVDRHAVQVRHGADDRRLPPAGRSCGSTRRSTSTSPTSSSPPIRCRRCRRSIRQVGCIARTAPACRILDLVRWGRSDRGVHAAGRTSSWGWRWRSRRGCWPVG